MQQLPFSARPPEPLDDDIDRALAVKTMPAGALGRLGDLARRIARIQRTAAPRIHDPAIVVFAADHGIARAGVSAYPQAVTRQMLANFLAGGAAVSVLARASGLRLIVVDAGVAHAGGEPDRAQPATDPTPDARPAFVDAAIAPGTQDCSAGPAMTRAQCERALSGGAAVVRGLSGNTVGFGEMGIGNTSVAALLTARFTGAPLEACVGRGTGLDDAGLARKRAVLARAWALHDAATDPARGDPLGALAALGGLEIAMMAGAMIEAARRGMVIVVDGFVSTAALLAARALQTYGTAAGGAAGGLDRPVVDCCVFAHRSTEPGHAIALASLGADDPVGADGAAPLLEWGMRLGEGSGAALAMPLLKAAADVLREMATFESAGVAGPAA